MATPDNQYQSSPGSITDGETEQPNPVGRPPKFKTVQELDLAIQNYFAECDPHTQCQGDEVVRGVADLLW